MKKIYERPAVMVVKLQHQCLICESVTRTENDVNLNYRGSGNGTARVKEQGSHNVWDDDWSE